MFEKFTEQGIKILNDARAEAEKRRHPAVDVEHLILAVLQNERAMQFLRDKGHSPEKMRIDAENSLQPCNHVLQFGDLPFSPRAKNAIKHAIHEAKLDGKENNVSTEHILMAITKQFLLHKHV